ncbi:MAG TPA: hypothetical protein ENN68_07785 [Methanomicrobia archaeon]|nr:hypothetical protein [Methanomicrobia archaeon]
MSADCAAARAGGAVIPVRKSKKPVRDHRTIVISKDAYAVLTRRAEEAGSDRKTIASKAITTYTTENEVLNGLQRAIADNNDLTRAIQSALMEKLKPGAPELSGEELKEIVHAHREIAQTIKETAHALKELESIRPARSTDEHISYRWLDDCYPPEQSRKQQDGDSSVPAGGVSEE